MIGTRDITTLSWVLRRKETYRAVANAFFVLRSPLAVLGRDVFSRSPRLDPVAVRTPTGPALVRVFHRVDLSTVLGVFCREDYRIADRERSIVVDVGSNVGISALYFLTRHPENFVYCCEPVPRNVERLALNLRGHEARYTVEAKAVASVPGPVRFHVEATGKFGGLRAPAGWEGADVLVPTTSIDALLQRAIDEHGQVDCLKLDVEGHEEAVLDAIDARLLPKVRTIYAENCSVKRPELRSHYVESRSYNVLKLTARR